MTRHAALVFPVLLSIAHLHAAPTELVAQKPAKISAQNGIILLDFGKVAFANLELAPPQGSDQKITIRFGEDLKNGHLNRKPSGTVRFSSIKLKLTGNKTQIAAPPAHKHNTKKGNPPAILTPEKQGVRTPFRWVEIEGWPGDAKKKQFTRRAAFAAAWDDDAAANLLPRYILGAQPLKPGWKSAAINPQTAGLEHAEGKIPTPRGPVTVMWKNERNFIMKVQLPDGMPAQISLPATKNARQILLNGKATPAKRLAGRLVLDKKVTGTAIIEVK